jgi:excisionase family DNA binding protein
MHTAITSKVKRRPTPPQRFHTVEDLVEMFAVDVRTIYRWIANGSLRAYKIGGVLRVSEEDLRDFLEKSRV